MSDKKISTLDPVCGMTADPKISPSYEYEGTTHFFCSDHCCAKFSNEPKRFFGEVESLLEAPDPGGLYTCSMHPLVVSDEFGSCSICGMALEPVTVSLEEEDNPELQAMTRRFWVSAVLSLPLLLVSMGEMFPAVSIGTFSRNAGGDLGGLAFLPERLGFSRLSKTQHVYPYLARHGRRLWL